MDEKPERNAGMQLATISLLSALIEKLRAQGVLTREQIVEVITHAIAYADLFGNEGMTPLDTHAAVRLLDDMKRSYRDELDIDE